MSDGEPTLPSLSDDERHCRPSLAASRVTTYHDDDDLVLSDDGVRAYDNDDNLSHCLTMKPTEILASGSCHIDKKIRKLDGSVVTRTSRTEEHTS